MRAFEVDLQAQREMAEDFGAELRQFKIAAEGGTTRYTAEIARLEQECRASRERLSVVSSQAEEARRKCAEVERWRDVHQCGVYVCFNSY